MSADAPTTTSVRLDSVIFPRLWNPRVTPLLMIVSVAGSTVLQTFFSGALTIALPSIGAQLDFGGEDLQWPLTIFALFNGAFLLICGALADAFGRRLFFFTGVTWLLVACIAITFAQTGTAFIALSGVLGLGCAILSPSATGLLSMLPEGSLRNTSYSALGAGQPLGFVAGLFAGGFLSTHRGQWHIIMYLMAGCAAIFLALGVISLPADVKTPAHASPLHRRLLNFDWLGAFLSTAGLVLLTFALADAGSSSRGWKSPFVPAMLPLAVLGLLSFALWERRLEGRFVRGETTIAPLLPHSIWKVPTLKPLLGMIFFAWSSFNSFSYFSTLYIQEVQQLSPIQAAVRFVPMICSGVIYNFIAAMTMARLHGLWLVTAGCLGGIFSCLIFCLIDARTNYFAGLFIAFILTTSTDLIFPPSQLVACQCVGPSRAALAGGVFSTTTRLATSLGLALTATISSAATKLYVQHHAQSSATSPEALLKGYQAAVWFCFALSIVAMLIGFIWLRGIGIVGFNEGKDKERAETADADRKAKRDAEAVAAEVAADAAPSSAVTGLAALLLHAAGNDAHDGVTETARHSSGSTMVPSVRSGVASHDDDDIELEDVTRQTTQKTR